MSAKDFCNSIRYSSPAEDRYGAPMCRHFQSHGFESNAILENLSTISKMALKSVGTSVLLGSLNSLEIFNSTTIWIKFRFLSHYMTKLV